MPLHQQTKIIEGNPSFIAALKLLCPIYDREESDSSLRQYESTFKISRSSAIEEGVLALLHVIGGNDLNDQGRKDADITQYHAKHIPVKWFVAGGGRRTR